MALITHLDEWAPSGMKAAPSATLQEYGYVAGSQPAAQAWNHLEAAKTDKINEVIDAMPQGFPPDTAAQDHIVKKYMPIGSDALWHASPAGYTINSGNTDIIDLCVVYNSDGLPRVLVLDGDTGGNRRIYVVDPADMSVESNSGDLGGANLPTGQGTHYCSAMCTDGESVYVMFQSSSGYHNLQAYDLWTWDRKSAWPTTGLALPTPNDAVVQSWRRGRVIIADNTHLATANSWVRCTGSSSNGISIVALADGTLIDSGAGDIGDQSSEYFYPYRIASDGEYIFALFTEHSSTGAPNGDRIWSDLLATVSIADPDTGIGSPYPYEPGADCWAGDVVVMGSRVYTSWGDTTNRRVLRLHSRTNAEATYLSFETVGKGRALGSLCCDGMALWGRGARTIQTSVAVSDSLWRVNIGAMELFNATDDSAGYVDDHANRYTASDLTTTTLPEERLCAPLCFDGRDLFYAGNILATEDNGSILYVIRQAVVR